MSEIKMSENIGRLEPTTKGTEDDVKDHGGQSLKIKSDIDITCENEGRPRPCDQVTTQDDQKRKKTRRARKARANKRKPYSKLLRQGKGGELDKARDNASNERAKMFSYGLPEAPYNTTQFLMEDHNDLKDLDVKLQAATTNSEGQNVKLSIPQRPARARDSSFSMDSDDDYFYSSPSDEEEFLTRDFSNTYQDIQAERLGTLSKSQLIQDYVQLTGKMDLLEKRLQKYGSKIKEVSSSSDAEREVERDGSVESESQKSLLYQQEMNHLVMENERLTRENERLRDLCAKGPSVSSVDSESDSTDSTCSSSSSSDSGENTEVQTNNDTKTLVQA